MARHVRFFQHDRKYTLRPAETRAAGERISDSGGREQFAEPLFEHAEPFAFLRGDREDLDLLAASPEVLQLCFRAGEIHLVCHDDPWALAERGIVEVQFL